MSRWTWGAVEPAIPGTSAFVITEGGKVQGGVYLMATAGNPTAALNALCAALAGQEPARPAPDPGPEQPPKPLSAKQRTAIILGFEELGYTRDTRLAAISSFLGREVTTANQLDEVEAGLILDRLQQKLAAKRRGTAA